MIAIYARQSVDKRDSISIDTQMEACQKELYALHMPCKIYADRGYSGSNLNRPQFEALLRDIRAGLIDIVTVYRIDRISRSLLDFMRIYEMFQQNGVEFVSCTEKFDTGSPMGKAMLSIIMVFAQLERETIQMRIRDNYYARGEKGLYLGGRAPYGYRKVPVEYGGIHTHTFQEDPEQADIVRMLFRAYAETEASFGHLVKQLNGMGIRTNRGNAWSGVSLGRLIRNPVYVRANADVYLYLKNKGARMNNGAEDYSGENGCYLYASRDGVTTMKFTDLSRSYVTLGLHLGIIDAATWLRCQAKADGNKVLKNSGKGTHTWLSGLIKCGYCGFAVLAVNGYRNQFYVSCGGRRRYICSGRKKTVLISEIEAIVQSKLLERMRELTVRKQPEPNREQKHTDALKGKLADLDERIERLVISLTGMSDVSSGYVDAKIQELDAEKCMVQHQLNEHIRSEAGTPEGQNGMQEYIDRWDAVGTAQKRAAAKALIARIILTDEELKIEFRL